MFTYVKVFGERNSGTIYLTGLIRENTNAIILEGDTRGKGGSLNGQNVLFKGAYTGDNDYLQDLDHFRILQSDFGWKHAAPPTDVMNFSLHGYLTKFIFTAKHPCFWLQSIFKRPYNPRLSSIGSFSEFIRSPWPVSRRDNIGSESVLETPIDLFNRKVTSYIECLDKFPENSAFVKYEDLLHDTQGSVERVCNGVLGAGTIPFKNLMRSTKSADENFDFYKKKYTSRDYLDQISKEDLTFIGSKLSARVLDFCGYKVAVATDLNGLSKGYGFVQFDNEESAQKAIEKLNGMLLNDKQVYVGPFLRKQERETEINMNKFNNVYVKNLSEAITEEDLQKIFGEFGTITSVVVMRDADGKSKCFGFVNFENADDAANAVEALNGKKFDDKEWYVGKAQRKSEREVELKYQFEQNMKEVADKFQGANLYMKNLDDSIDDDKLKQLFSQFGSITSCKVMRDPNGISRGSGFVAFTTPEEASRAILEMNGKMVVSKPLFVALAQRKEDRRARLQAQFSQIRPVAMAPSVASRMPMYPPGGPGLGQQLFYGQAPPAMIPPQPGFGYQQQLVPGMRPAGAPMQNFYVPVVPPGQQSQRPSGRRAGAMQQTQQHVPVMQPQMLPRGRVYRYPSGRGLPDVPMPGVGGMLSVPYDMGGMALRNAAIPQPIPIGTLASALANASPEQQRMMLGESLYPHVEQLEPEAAAKVTGMLLEMDQTEVLHLLESPEALKAKVAEAMEVLRNVAQQQQAGSAADQLASLSLTD